MRSVTALLSCVPEQPCWAGYSEYDRGPPMPADVPSPDFLCSDSELSRELFHFDSPPPLPPTPTYGSIEAVSGIIVFLIVNERHFSPVVIWVPQNLTIHADIS